MVWDLWAQDGQFLALLHNLPKTNLKTWEQFDPFVILSVASSSYSLRKKDYFFKENMQKG